MFVDGASLAGDALGRHMSLRFIRVRPSLLEHSETPERQKLLLLLLASRHWDICVRAVVGAIPGHPSIPWIKTRHIVGQTSGCRSLATQGWRILQTGREPQQMPIGKGRDFRTDTGDEERDGRRAGKVTTRPDEAVEQLLQPSQAGRQARRASAERTMEGVDASPIGSRDCDSVIIVKGRRLWPARPSVSFIQTARVFRLEMPPNFTVSRRHLPNQPGISEPSVDCRN